MLSQLLYRVVKYHGSISAITEKIKPAVDAAKALGLNGKDLIEKSTDLNIQNAMKDISREFNY